MEEIISKNVEQILKKIRETRKTKGLSHENMAFELGMSPSAYNKLERNETTLSLERLLRINQILEIPITDLFEIKNGDVYHQDLKDHSIGSVQNLFQENKEIYEKLIAAKDEQIAFLKTLLENK